MIFVKECSAFGSAEHGVAPVKETCLVALAVEGVTRVAVAGELPRDVLDDVVLVVGGAAEELSKGVVDDVNRGRSEDPGVVKGVGYDRERTKTSARRKR